MKSILRHCWIATIVVSLVTTACFIGHTRWNYVMGVSKFHQSGHQLKLTVSHSYLLFKDEVRNRSDTSFAVRAYLDIDNDRPTVQKTITVESLRISFTQEGTFKRLSKYKGYPRYGKYSQPCDYYWLFTVPKPRPDTIYFQFDLVTYSAQDSTELERRNVQEVAILWSDHINVIEQVDSFY